MPLSDHGLEWVQPEIPLAHPLDDGSAAVLMRSVRETSDRLGTDGPAYHRLMQPLVDHAEALAEDFLGPLLHWPRHPLVLARFGLRGLRSASSVARISFIEQPARALFAGLAAHSFLSLDQIPSSAFGLVLALFGHSRGWPMPRGGSGMLSHALAEYFRRLGGEIVLTTAVENLQDTPNAPIRLLDISPRQFVRIAADKMPANYRKKMEAYRYGPGVFKVDYALSGPIPWRAKECRRAGTVHLGGTFEEIARAEQDAIDGKHPEHPFVLLAQPTLFDSTRAPAGKHIAWAYAHVPNGSNTDLTERIDRQIERFAPGFGQRILARHTLNCLELEKRNANLIGGDINGGAADLRQLLARPVLSTCPYRTPIPGVYLCSASTPPGGGVHGMCGYHAANAALRDR
jgi:phytoene dehydrogenase-like protein